MESEMVALHEVHCLGDFEGALEAIQVAIDQERMLPYLEPPILVYSPLRTKVCGRRSDQSLGSSNKAVTLGGYCVGRSHSSPRKTAESSLMLHGGECIC